MNMSHFKPVREDRLRRLSRRLALSCLVFAGILPLLVLVDVAAGGASGLLSAATSQPIRVAPNRIALAIGVALALVPACLLSAGFLSARRALLAFAAEAWFSAAPSLRAFGRWIAIAGLTGLLLPTALGLALTLGEPAGERVLVFSINSGAISTLLIGCVIWAVGHVWAQAAALRSELDGFV